MKIRKKPLPIGISDYSRAISEYYYIDKTLLIRELIDNMPQVSLFLRPRRFGKTLNMDMIRTFFEKSDRDTSKYFEQTAIWKEGEKYKRHQGIYPVIFFTFKDMKFSSWSEVWANIRAAIQREYDRLLTNSMISNLDDSDVAYISRVKDGPAHWGDLLSCLMRYMVLRL